jgi:hypothetical protein
LALYSHILVSFIVKYFATQFTFYAVLNATAKDLALLHVLEYVVHSVVKVATSMAALQLAFIYE